MKTGALLRHLRQHGCHLKREGGNHAIWTNPRTGQIEAVPRHGEIPNILARKICCGLSGPGGREIDRLAVGSELAAVGGEQLVLKFG